MDEYTRIAELLESGKITADEARRLIEALEEPPAVAAGEGAAAGAQVRVRLRRAELTVRAVAGLDAPRLEGGVGEVSLERSGAGWRLFDRTAGLELGGLLGFLRGVVLRKAALLVPERSRLSVHLGQGALRTQGPLESVEGGLGQGTAQVAEASGVRFEVGQGTLTVERAEALDLEVGQGTIEAAARLAEGRHRAEAGMGRVRVRLLEGSDVVVVAHAGMGKVRLAGEEGVGKKTAVEARVGSGRARLQLEAGMGDVEVKLP